jgi:hypothetical protein
VYLHVFVMVIPKIEFSLCVVFPYVDGVGEWMN